MFGKNSVVIGAILALSSATAATSHAPTAVVRPGLLIGTTTVLPSSTATVNKFLSIPYAVTPPRRFLPPERLVKYPGPVNATQPPHLCIQQNYAHETPAQVADESEDCLYLNVYAPAGCKGGRAVMVWIHGGDLSSGTSSAFDGASIAGNQDVVVVTFNYRVNAIGFSNAPTLPLSSRNAGFWDQRLALAWVQDNIAAFGGDPRKVTVFGESSGASSIDRLLLTTTLPDRQPFFRAAILQSGQATVSPFPRDGGPAAWSALAAALNCTSATSAPAGSDAEFACVSGADALTVRSIVNAAGLEFRPVNDNVTQRATPLTAEARRPAARVPVLIGSNGQEGMNLGPQYGISNFSSVTEEEVEQFLYAVTGSEALVGQIGRLIDEIQGAAPWLNLFEVGALLYTEVLYQCPCKLVAEASVQDKIPTWRYYYNATIPNVQPEGYPTLGAFHGAELDVVWGTYPAANATEQEVALSSFIQTAWANFAKDPMAGPGWKALDAASDEIACLGCDGGSGVQIMAASVVDSRCEQYAPLYTASTPYF